MSKKIKVSYVLGILNAERTLEECLNGILSQEFSKKDYEIIIVDGGSKDKTLEIVRNYSKKYPNIHLFHNPYKLSEGKGMAKDQGIKKAKGEFIVLLDHDNIITDKNWLKKMLLPLRLDKKIMATQSFLYYQEKDSNFLKYINALGVEDSFAIPYSIVAQATLHPEKFILVKNKYYLPSPKKKLVLFGGANGAVFRKNVFEIIGGYTRDVNISASMTKKNLQIAMVKGARLYHKSGSNFFNFLKKKAIYFYRFITFGYKEESFRWIPHSFSGKIRFTLMIISNLTLIFPLIFSIKQIIKTGEFFWIFHPFYLFSMTLLYGFMTLFKIKNFFKYKKQNSIFLLL